jgi:error-prone DNA polymerase
MPSPFVHLDVRSYFSIKEGAFSPEHLARRAAELGMPAVAMTDRDGLYGATRFVVACEREGVRPILGTSLTLVGGAHVVLLARDATGYANLCRLITDAHMMGERGEPELAPAQVCAHANGLTALLGRRSPSGAHALRGQMDTARHTLEPFREAFGENCFVAVEDRMEAGSSAEIRTMLRLADSTGTPVVATNAVRYLVPEGAFLADALECMRRIVPIASNNVTRTNSEGYFKSAPKMRELFSERPDLCDATLDIAARCTFDIGLKQVHFPEFPTPAGRSASSVLSERCHRGIDARGMESTREVHDRLEHELAMIDRMGYPAYFLTVADIVDDIRAMGIHCACRGSAAGSLVTYLTGISDVDAVRHNLSFERFLNPLRDELPDIDIDVESARREDVYDMVLSRYGDDRAACVSMIDTYRARSAVREVGKALALPETEVGIVAKAFPHISAHRMREALEALPELAGSNINAGQLELLFRVAERLNGFPRHVALHPSGIVLSNDDLGARVPLERSFQGYRMIQADKDDVELLGYLKLDVLGIRMLSAMRHALDEIARTEHQKVDLDRVPLDDEPTFELIRDSDTVGCFQIESPGQRELLQKFQPTRWEDLIVDISLFRPGPVKSDMIAPFLRRRHGYEAPVYAHPALKPVLRETNGVVVFHEQVIRSLEAIGGYDPSYADYIRRNLDNDELFPELRADFMTRAADRGVDADAAERVWRELAAFASFGFCKAHAAAFAVPTYQSAWLKTHYPAHFLAGVLTHDPGMYPRRLILEDAREHGIAILPLDVNRSEPEYVVEVVASASTPAEGSRPHCSDRPSGGLDDAVARPSSGCFASSDYGIRLALNEVHGISDAEIRSILEARADRLFRDLGDFTRRVQVSQPVTEALAHTGAFDALDPGIRTRRDRLFEAITTEPQHEGEQLALAVYEPVTTALPEYSDAEKVRAELDVLGLDASRHIISFFEPLLADLGVTRSRDLYKMRANTPVVVAGVKVSSQTPGVRSGQRIIFLTLDDATGPVEVVVFESAQAKCARIVFHSFALAVSGTLRRTGVKGVSILAEEAWDLVALNRARAEGDLERAMRERTIGGATSSKRLWHASPGSAG